MVTSGAALTGADFFEGGAAFFAAITTLAGRVALFFGNDSLPRWRHDEFLENFWKANLLTPARFGQRDH
jgi:hypothetical protein